MQADLLDVLTRLASASNIRCMRVTPPFDGLDQFDYGLRKALDPYFDWQEFGSLLLQSTPPNTLLFAEGTFELQFALFRIPDEENAVFMIGPWATAERSEKSRSWARRHIGEKGDDAVQSYYNGGADSVGQRFPGFHRGSCFHDVPQRGIPPRPAERVFTVPFYH